MGETIVMSVPQARIVLGNTRALSSEQVEEAEKIVNAFYGAKPRRACLACGSMVWTEHSAGGDDVIWACSRCHKPATLTQEGWFEQQRAEREAADAHLRATEATAPADPRQALSEALGRLEAAKAGLSKLEVALPAARGALAAATLKHERATEEAETATERAAASLLAGFQGAPTGPAPSPAATRAALAAASDGLEAARAAKGLLDEQLSAKRSAVATANAFARKAAIAVLVAERLDPLLDEVAESRAQYTESTGRLAWLLKTHLIPGTDSRARQLLDANTPPSAWREAATAGVQAMEAAMAALLADPEAAI